MNENIYTNTDVRNNNNNVCCFPEDLNLVAGRLIYIMGIKHLWSLLEPYAERKPLSDLQGKVVCVDLSGWVCESMNITDYKIQPKMYIK